MPNPSAEPDASLPTSLAPVAWTALAYALAGVLSLLLAIPPGYASPLYPAAGIALASVLVFGRRMLPAVWLGAAAVEGADVVRQNAFRDAAVTMKRRLDLMLALPLGTLDAMAIRRQLRQIGDR